MRSMKCNSGLPDANEEDKHLVSQRLAWLSGGGASDSRIFNITSTTSVTVLKSDDIVFAKILPALHLNHNQWNNSGIFKAVFIA